MATALFQRHGRSRCARGVDRARCWPPTGRARLRHGRVHRRAARCQKTEDTFPAITPHDLRHTAASLAVSAGANDKAVQRMLGHAKASMVTLDVYADLFDEDWPASRPTWAPRSELLRTHCLPGNHKTGAS